VALPSGKLDKEGLGGTGNGPLQDLLPALQRLDQLLDWAAGEMQSSRCADRAVPFHGLYITPEDVSELLSRSPGQGEIAGDRPAVDAPWLDGAVEPTPINELVRAFALSSFEVDTILLALAPELDLRYERLYAYLQDDVTKKRPTVDLAFNLLCAGPEQRVERRVHFSASAPLLGKGLIHFVFEPGQAEPLLLARPFRLDPHVVDFLLGGKGLDPCLREFCELLTPRPEGEQTQLREDVKEVLPFLAAQAFTTHRPLRLLFQGPPGTGKRGAAEALAGSVGANLITAALGRVAEKPEFDRLLTALDREACLHDAVLYLSETDVLQSDDLACQHRLLQQKLAQFPGTVILAGRNPLLPEEAAGQTILTIAFEPPTFRERREFWRSKLEAIDLRPADGELDSLASRFHLTGERIEHAVNRAVQISLWRAAKSAASGANPAGASKPRPSLEDMYQGARSQSGQDLAKLARKIEPRYSWSDIVLPSDPIQQLREICGQAEYRHVVFNAWGFEHKLSLGKGLNALFSGPPGTGKTMAAEVIAHELLLDLYRIDLSQVISKYIGETEKNLDRIFAAAETSNSILFFDEADALFGKRSEVRDSHDRYANIEISYLLQKMEEYQGISILATNLRQNLDEAFVRRLQAIVEFPFPDEKYRLQIWKLAFPGSAPLGSDVDFERLAHEVKLAGGNIKNMALAAAFYAAADGGPIHMPHLAQAARREHQKLGRAWDESALLEPLGAAS
jgi:SpoVK/Ycf46/Vps4 family AAA+-type ATPase